MFLDVLSISASNVLRMFLNINVNIAGVHLLFSSHTHQKTVA